MNIVSKHVIFAWAAYPYALEMALALPRDKFRPV